MAYSQKIAIFLFFTSIPAIMSLKCYIGTTVGNAGSTLQTCPAEVKTLQDAMNLQQQLVLVES